MAADVAREGSIRELEDRLTAAVDGHPPLTLTPAWWQQRLLEWATNDPSFRVNLLRFVDVLPTLRTAAAIADHVRQYFRADGRPGGSTAPWLVRSLEGVAGRRGTTGIQKNIIAIRGRGLPRRWGGR